MIAKNTLFESHTGLYFRELKEARTPSQSHALLLLSSIKDKLPSSAYPLLGSFEKPGFAVGVDASLGVGFEMLLDRLKYRDDELPVRAAVRIADTFPGTAVFFQNGAYPSGKYIDRHTITVMFPLENYEEIPTVAAASVQIVRDFLPDWTDAKEGAIEILW